MSRHRLVRRIETEAREGYWRKRDAVAAGELVQNRYRVDRIRVLLGADHDKLWQASDIAAFLGVTRQRVDQHLADGRLPEPSRDGRVRKWERETIVRWAKDHRPAVWHERS